MSRNRPPLHLLQGVLLVLLVLTVLALLVLAAGGEVAAAQGIHHVAPCRLVQQLRHAMLLL
jgi:hypothetical protein